MYKEERHKMGGIFGTFLESINSFGEAILKTLIGDPAKRETERARWARIICGSIVLSGILGFVVFIILASTGLIKPPPNNDFIALPCCLIPGVIIFGSISLELLRKWLDKE